MLDASSHPGPALLDQPTMAVGPGDLARLLDAVPVATVLLEPEGLRLLAGNAEAAAMLGCSPECLSAAWHAALGGAEGEALRRRLAAVTAETTPEVFDAVLPHPGRVWRAVLVRARLTTVAHRRVLSAGLVDITRRRRAEDGLAAAHARLQVALQGADLGAWHWQAEGDRLEVDARWAAMLGLAPDAVGEGLVGWEALLHPEDADCWRTAMQAMLRGDTPQFEASCRLRHREGHWVWVLARGQAMRRDPAGRALVATGTHLDITDRVAAERALADQAQQLRALLEASPIGMQRASLDGRVLDANAALLRLTGASREDLAAGRLRWDAVTPQAWREADRNALGEVLAKGYSTPYEKEYRLPDGRLLPVLVGSALLDRAAGEVATFVLDLSALKRAEAALAQSEREARRRLAELEKLYRTAPMGLAQFDRELRVVRINEALARMNGAPVEAHLGRVIWELTPDLRQAAEPLLRQVLDTGEAITDIEFSGETPFAPGVRREWKEQLYPLRDPETREVVGVGVVCEEVTERRVAQRTQELLLRELDHRVKNLFAVISGLISFSARHAACPAAMSKALLGRIQALARAHDLVRPAMGGRGMEAVATSLGQVAETVLQPFAAMEPGRLTLDGPDLRVGPLAAPPLALVLHELATNAAKYGSLARPEGRLLLVWEAGPEGGILLRWQESDGAPVTMPEDQGFGHRLVQQCIAQLGGTAHFTWRPEGLMLELRLPEARLVH